jgi:ATP-dependent DNA helicase RecQ
VAGRRHDDLDKRLSLFAVGDDDQNIYAFDGASVEFIRRFEADYSAKPSHLLENYRSTANIIQASNRVIASAADRMKTDHDITVDAARREDPPGGALERLDSVGRGRVQILKDAEDPMTQAVLAVEELERLSKITPDWSWANAAVIAREWKYLDPVRSYCEARGIPAQAARDEMPSIWHLRETQSLVSWLRSKDRSGLHVDDLKAWMAAQPDGPWWSILRDGVEEFALDVGDRDTDRNHVLNWIAEWGRDVRQRQNGLLLVSAHGAKGLEFDDVVVLDGGWDKRSDREDEDAARRLFYVAMTRARRSLALMSMAQPHPIIEGLDDDAVLIRDRRSGGVDVSECRRKYITPTPRQVDWGYAGRLHDGNRSLRAIDHLKPGDPLSLRQRDGRWCLEDRNGTQVGRLTGGFAPPPGTDFLRGSVYAISTHSREASSEEYQDRIKRDAWSVVLPELVFSGR